jgi:hypothetical protein
MYASNYYTIENLANILNIKKEHIKLTKTQYFHSISQSLLESYILF